MEYIVSVRIYIYIYVQFPASRLLCINNAKICASLEAEKTKLNAQLKWIV